MFFTSPDYVEINALFDGVRSHMAADLRWSEGDEITLTYTDNEGT